MDRFLNTVLAILALIPITVIIGLSCAIYYESSTEVDSHSYDHVKMYVDLGYPNIEHDMLDGKISKNELQKMRRWYGEYCISIEMQKRAEKRAKLLKAEKNE